jgi:hypothetical protein
MDRIEDGFLPGFCIGTVNGGRVGIGIVNLVCPLRRVKRMEKMSGGNFAHSLHFSNARPSRLPENT